MVINIMEHLQFVNFSCLYNGYISITSIKKDGIMNGKGVYTFNNGDRYEG